MQADGRRMALQAKIANKQKAIQKEGRIKRQIFLCFFENRFRSGGEENERQMANNVMKEMRVYGGYLEGLK